VDDVLAGSYHSAFKGRGMEFEEVRPYQIGDDVRSIDWNVSARFDEPFIKLHREERELTVILLVDVSGSQRFGTHEQFKDELVAEVCATLALSAIRNNDKVGMICFTDKVEKYIPPRKGSRHVLRVIRELLTVEASGEGTDIGTAIEFLNRVQKRGAIVFLVSDMIDHDWSKPLQIARRRHDMIVVRTGDAAEHDIPNIGLLQLEDAEGGNTTLVNTASPRVRRAWRQLAAEHSIAVEQTLRRSRVDEITLQTGTPFSDALHRFFRRREARR